jgi:wyosine [tRNA(Phe)-imidazoG37] synthetase (radical SAM superfamily)
MDQVEAANEAGEQIDYRTFVPDGKPTLSANLDRGIELLKPSGLKVAVSTDTSFIWDQGVQGA